MGHNWCNWQHTLKNAYTRQTFKEESWNTLDRKGAYPLNSNSWYLTQLKYLRHPRTVFETPCIIDPGWHCPCCGSWVTD
eukprot:2266955-Prorocentrum_lima.AAC.1